MEGEEVMIQLEGLLGKSSTHTAPGESPDTCDYHVTAIVVCTGMEVCVGEEIVSCVLSVEGEEVRVSLNPALLERCDLKTEGGEKKKKKRRSSAKKQAMVRTLSNSLSLSIAASPTVRGHTVGGGGHTVGGGGHTVGGGGHTVEGGRVGGGHSGAGHTSVPPGLTKDHPPPLSPGLCCH